MTEPAPDIILQVEQADGRFRCRGFSGVPASRYSWIALVSTGSAEGRRLACDLAAELESVLLSASPLVAATDIACPTASDQMRPSDYPDRRKVLVVIVGSTDARLGHVAWHRQWDSDQHQAAVMVVLPPGNRANQFDATVLRDDQHLLSRVNAANWSKKITEVLPNILARAEITSDASRVFISYRRLETLPVALQLFDRLGHEGFNVFLDRFSIEPGYDFQRRLKQELEDKSMVVLLESKWLWQSKWTQHEIDFAKRHRLGMMALRMPDVADADEIRSIAFDARDRLKPEDFVGGPARATNPDGSTVNQWPPLVAAALDRVVAGIKAAHAAALFRRRHRLRGDIVAALKAEAEVIDQLRGLLRAPEIVVRTWRAARRSGEEISEGEVREALERLDTLWEELFPAEQAGIVHLLVERVDLGLDGADIRLRTEGLTNLVADLCSVRPEARRAA